MSIFDFDDGEALGSVLSVDTATVVVRVDDVERLRQLQVNRLAMLRSSRPGQHLIGVIQKITRSAAEPKAHTRADVGEEDEESLPEVSLARIALIGTLIDRVGQERDVFRRTLETVPEIEARCFAIEGERLTRFMRVISSISGDGHKLLLGHYTLDDRAEAYLNGNKFFQRHAIIVGSTGSGKSWATARILEQVAALPNANAVVFDIHGEYGPLAGAGFRHYRVAGPADLDQPRANDDGVLFLPYWLLGYEALVSMFVDRTDQNAPNQAMVMARAIMDAKKAYLISMGQHALLANFTIDSPVPFSIEDVIRTLTSLNTEVVEGARAGATKQGDFHGKLSRMIQRLESRRSDRRLAFLFGAGDTSFEMGWLERLVAALLASARGQADNGGGIKVIDFSEVPSDVLPVMVSLVAKLALSVQQWALPAVRHPVALFCDEAHLYLPDRSGGSAADEVSVGIFERIAKEGRKYGVGLVVISQRPSEVNRTVLSQCNNLLAMRLTNGEDQSVIRRLLPDSLGGYGDLLPVLDTGEALVVGDASLLPSRIRLEKPTHKPNSGTVDFWDRWASTEVPESLAPAVSSWQRQTFRTS
ncbi:ATP-binding protein [Siccirubricoccus sp. G192]|uniref:ATP-binding protein n=1 Tax=Siccirubricoccus sp. G192 TaxID=2849651 RepID=UPI001C2C2BBF|nr:ATP-binding protein [Siccirubricoccus sp. G192]MBV1800490.1 ATP-binding protein [Siccirubricoccus sp. G192]